jgi:hypothetical protein
LPPSPHNDTDNDALAQPDLGPVVQAVDVQPPRSWPLLIAAGAVPLVLGLSTALRAQTLLGRVIGGAIALVAFIPWVAAFLVRGQTVCTTLYERGVCHETRPRGGHPQVTCFRWADIEAVAHRAVDRFRGKRYVGSLAVVGLRGKQGETVTTIRRRIYYQRDAKPTELQLWLAIENAWLISKRPT